jgi:hypothetical protein
MTLFEKIYHASFSPSTWIFRNLIKHTLQSVRLCCVRLNKCSLFGSQHNSMVSINILKYSLCVRRKANINRKYICNLAFTTPHFLHLLVSHYLHIGFLKFSDIHCNYPNFISFALFKDKTNFFSEYNWCFLDSRSFPHFADWFTGCFRNGKTNVSFTQNCAWSDRTEERTFVSNTKSQGALVISLWIELNGIWVRAPTGPMHLGLKTGPLCPIFWTEL